MPAPLQAFATVPVSAAVSVVTTAETVVATVTIPSVPSAGLTVRILALLKFTLGTAATAITCRIRRNSLTGTLVGVATPTQGTAGNTVDAHIEGEDSPGEVAQQSYVVTVQQTAATGNGSCTQAEVAAFVS